MTESSNDIIVPTKDGKSIKEWDFSDFFNRPKEIEKDSNKLTDAHLMQIINGLAGKPNLKEGDGIFRSKAEFLDNRVKIAPIDCYKSNDKIFDHYDEMHLADDITRQRNKVPYWHTPYDAIAHFHSLGMVLPNAALTCNALMAMFYSSVSQLAYRAYKILDHGVMHVLDSYKNYYNGLGWHLQNTLVDFSRQCIIHFPNDHDFPYNYNGGSNINSRFGRIVLPFDKKKVFGGMLSDMVDYPDTKRFLQKLTGLAKPNALMALGQYFKRPVKVRLPYKPEENNGIYAVLVGCNRDNFEIVASQMLGSKSGARGAYIGTKK